MLIHALRLLWDGMGPWKLFEGTPTYHTTPGLKGSKNIMDEKFKVLALVYFFCRLGMGE